MTHKFDVTQKNKLDNPRRREVLPVDQILDCIDIQDVDIIGDIGCGIGYFTFPFAERVREKGRVYAVDVSDEMLKDVEAKIHNQGILNVTTVLSEEYNLAIPENTLNLAFLCTVAHEIDDLNQFLMEIHRTVKSKGRIMVIEWTPVPRDYGPPWDHCLKPGDLLNQLENAGFADCNVIPFNDYFYIVNGLKE